MFHICFVLQTSKPFLCFNCLFQIKLDERVSHTERGLLIRSLTQADSGVYYCHAVEHGFIQPLLRLTLQVIPSQRVGELLLRVGAADRDTPAKQKIWYRDFISLLEHPDLNSVDEFCEHVWKKERKQRGKKAPKAGLGLAQAQAQKSSQNLQTSTQIQNDGPKATKVPNLPKIQRSHVPQGTTSTDNQTNPKPSPSTTSKLPSAQATQNQSQGKRGNSPARRTPGSTAKWKQLQENKRGRNRRTHEQQRPPRSV